jgi:hypothetical protein
MIDSTVNGDDVFKGLSGMVGAYIGASIGVVMSSILIETEKMAETGANFAILGSVGAFVGLMLALYLVYNRKNSEQEDDMDLGSDAASPKLIKMQDMVRGDDDDLDNSPQVSPVGSIQ